MELGVTVAFVVPVGLVDRAPEAVCVWFSKTMLEVGTERSGPVEVGVEIGIGVGVEVGTVIEMPTVSHRLSVNAIVSSVSSDESYICGTETYFANRLDCIRFEGPGGAKLPKIDLYRCTRCP